MCLFLQQVTSSKEKKTTIRKGEKKGKGDKLLFSFLLEQPRYRRRERREDPGRK